jgi:hypothetical protein
VESLVVTSDMERWARPAVAPDVQAVLVALCLILVLETIATVGTFVLLFRLMNTNGIKCQHIALGPKEWEHMTVRAYLSSAAVSNFFGFFGQHSHM